MQQRAVEASRHEVDSWLKEVVASVVASSDMLTLDRSEFWDFLDQLPVAILISNDQVCSKIVGNRAAQALLQALPGRNLSQSAPETELPAFKVFTDGKELHPDDLPMQRAARTGEKVARSECEIRFPDRESIFIAGHCIPIQNEHGLACGSLGAFVDITPQRRQLERTDLLAREMVHRVKNTLSLVQSLAHNTLKGLIEPHDFSKFESRLVSIAKAQELIAETGAVVDFATLLTTAVWPVAQTQWVQVKLDGPPLVIFGDDATSLSMVFHELATNACKYGSLSAGGTIDVTWNVESVGLDSTVSVSWVEMGGPSVQTPEHLGFGTKLINRLVRSLSPARITRDFAPTGLRVVLVFQGPNAITQAPSASKA